MSLSEDDDTVYGLEEVQVQAWTPPVPEAAASGAAREDAELEANSSSSTL